MADLRKFVAGLPVEVQLELGRIAMGKPAYVWFRDESPDEWDMLVTASAVPGLADSLGTKTLLLPANPNDILRRATELRGAYNWTTANYLASGMDTSTVRVGLGAEISQAGEHADYRTACLALHIALKEVARAREREAVRRYSVGAVDAIAPARVTDWTRCTYGPGHASNVPDSDRVVMVFLHGDRTSQDPRPRTDEHGMRFGWWDGAQKKWKVGKKAGAPVTHWRDPPEVPAIDEADNEGVTT